MTHVRTSPYYPQSNGKLERWHQSGQTRKHSTALPALAGRRPPDRGRDYVEHYNNTRLNSAIGYVTPHDMIDGSAGEHPRRTRPEVDRRPGTSGSFGVSKPHEKKELSSGILQVSKLSSVLSEKLLTGIAGSNTRSAGTRR